MMSAELVGVLQPKLTVGVVVVLQSGFVDRCLQSLVECSLSKQKRLKIIIVLNSAQLPVIEIVSKYKEKYDFIQVITNSSNLGYAAACNQILEITQTDNVCFIHSDTIISFETLELLQYIFLKATNSLLGISPKTNYASDHFPCIETLRNDFIKIKPSNKEFITSEQIDNTLNTLYNDFENFCLQLKENNLNRPLENFEDITSFCCLFRCSSLRYLGGFNEEFRFRGYEDKELLLRALAEDYKFGVCRIAFAHHHGNLTTDGEGFYYPELMKEQEIVFNKFHEKHKSIKKDKKESALYFTEPKLCITTSFRKAAQRCTSLKSKRLLYFGTHYPPENAGGAELSVHETHLQLIKRADIEVCAFTIRNRFHKKFEFLNYYDYQGVKILQVPEETGEDLEEKVALVIEEFQPQVLLTHSLFAYYILKLVGHRYPNIERLFYFRHQTDILDGRLASLLKQDGGIQIISNSNWMQKLMEEKCERNSDLILPIITPKTCTLLEEQKTRSTVVIGNGVFSKGIKEILAIAKQLPNILFEVWGTLEPKIPKEMIPNNVIQKDWTTSISDLYHNAKVVLNLSVDPEPFGRTIVEAYYNGIPVIAHNEGGPKEIVKEGGILVENTSEAIAGIESIFNDDNYYKSLCEGTKRDLIKYNPYRENEKLLRLLLGKFQQSVYPEFQF